MLLATLALALVTLGALRLGDALARHETPRWDPREFHVLRHGGEPAGARETWVVPVNPGCGSCAALLGRVVQRARSDAARPRLVALLVDTGERRARAAAWRTYADMVAWDEDQVWRRRWGHRRYGEVLRFDVAGVLLTPEARGRGTVAATFELPARGR
jgi:hypothetical protein